MLLLVVSYLLISVSDGSCSYLLENGFPQPLNECSDHKENGVAISTQFSCFGDSVYEYQWNTLGCSGEATERSVIGDSNDTATGCSVACDGIIARIVSYQCADASSCKSQCDGDYSTQRYVTGVCFPIDGGKYATVNCTNSKIFLLEYTDSECKMGETEGYSLNQGCGTQENSNVYSEIEECPLDDFAQKISVFSVALLVLGFVSILTLY